MRVLLHAHRPRSINGAERYTQVLHRHLLASDRIEEVQIVHQEDERIPSGRWDLVHGMDLAPHRAGFAHRNGLPIVMTSHVAGWQNVRQGWRTGRRSPLLRGGQILKHASMLWRQACAIRDSTAVIAVSQSTRQELLRQAPWARRKVHVIENGVDANLFRAGQEDEGYGLFVGRMERVKQPQLAVQAFQRLGLPLRMVGRGPLRASLEAAAPANVRFEEPINDEALARLYQGASVCVVPSQSEGYPLVVLEALAAGVPVIAHRSFTAQPPTGQFIHWLDHGVFASRLAREQTPEAQVQDLMDAVRRHWGTKTADRAQRQHEVVAENNSWSRMVEQVVDLYEDVLRQAAT